MAKTTAHLAIQNVRWLANALKGLQQLSDELGEHEDLEARKVKLAHAVEALESRLAAATESAQAQEAEAAQRVTAAEVRAADAEAKAAAAIEAAERGERERIAKHQAAADAAIAELDRQKGIAEATLGAARDELRRTQEQLNEAGRRRDAVKRELQNVGAAL